MLTNKVENHLVVNLWNYNMSKIICELYEEEIDI